MPTVYSDRRILEIACFDVASCIQAQQAGADRIEFCADYAAGGVTPAYLHIQQVRPLIHLPLHVIIRPRGGDFVYTPAEKERMCQDILFCKQQGIDGVVWGALTTDHQVDVPMVGEVVALAKPMSITFHRAIDACADIDAALHILLKKNMDRVLTSGGKPTAWEGRDTLKYMQEQFGRHIVIMPGGGVRTSNLVQLMHDTQCREFHSAAMRSGILQPEEVRTLKNAIQQVG